MMPTDTSAPAEVVRGFWAGLDHIANFINALDTSEMTGREVRSAIYAECLSARPMPLAADALDAGTCSEPAKLWIQAVALAIEEADQNDRGIDGVADLYTPHPEVSDWSVHLALAVHKAIRALSSGKLLAADSNLQKAQIAPGVVGLGVSREGRE